ncbi:MAG: phosphoribosylformylglycinamidine synthase subunit PurL [Candidatus Woesearchaeota archaeon]
MGDRSKVDIGLVPVSGMKDNELLEFGKKNGISLKVNEYKKIVELIGRNPTITELHIFNIQWSEHSSYKSSKKVLKMLPTDAPNVILGPKEDSGIVELGIIDGEKYGIVVSHESHNHPSQVVPFEGAATGIGGDIRDVVCMGAKVLSTADPLRFGNPYGKNRERTRYIANEVINGIAGYGNPLGIPNLAGDVYFNDCFDDNCLVNVVCLGIVKEKDIIHSYAPKNSENYDIIVVGKATDNSGFGGASFASLILDEKDKDINKGAVQVPDPFLKNILIRASYKVFEEARKRKLTLGFKDMGAGGIMCATSELCSSGGYGCILDVDKIHVSMNIPDFIIVCGETQERFTWISPPDFTPTILKIYNEEFELPNVAEKARASVVGKVTKNKDYILKYNGKIVCNAPIDVVTSGIGYERERKKSIRKVKEPNLAEPKDYNNILLKILKNPIVASKKTLYERYDKEVLGLAVIRPGEADAGVQVAIPGKPYAVALAVDNNAKHGLIDPYYTGANAVAESMRNVAAVGAIPSALTDCLNYGNPELPEVFDDFYEGVRGIADAAKNIYYKGTKNPVPVISGNVSFYNQSAAGKAISPSPIIACIGVLKDYSKAITTKIKEENSKLFLIGPRKDELGASIYYEINNELGANVPKVDFELERNMIHSVLDLIDNRLLLSCHDISDGGFMTTVSEMLLGEDGSGNIGANINIDFSDLRTDKILFSESSGFVFEVKENNVSKVKEIIKKYKLELFELGKTTKEDKLIVNQNHKKIIDLTIKELANSWLNGYKDAMK